MVRSNVDFLVSPFVVSLALAASGCGGEGQPVESSDPNAGVGTDIGTTTEAFSGADLCSLINSLTSVLPTIGGSSVSITPTCTSTTVDNVYYNGAGQLSHTLSDLALLPSTTTGAYYCAIADSTNAAVDGTLSGGFGRFGLSARVDVTNRDPSHNTLTAYRTGTLWLFGAGAKLESQKLTFTDKSEVSSDGNWWGGYFGVQSSAAQWGITGSVTFPVGPVMVTITPGLSQYPYAVSDTNDSIKLSGTPSNPPLAPQYDYNTWAQCLLPNAPPCPRSKVTNAEMVVDHYWDCPADITSTTDGVLPYKNPYGGAACKQKNFIYVDGLHNYFEFGRPYLNSNLVPFNHLLANNHDLFNATVVASLDVQAAFSVDIVDISLDTRVDLSARDGFGVYQQHRVNADSPGGIGDVDVFTGLNAQTRAGMTIAATVELSGFLPPVHLSFTVPLGDTGNKESRTLPTDFSKDPTVAPVHMHYTDQPNSALTSYSVNSVYKTDAEGSLLSCMLGTGVSTATPPAGDEPGGFLKNVATNAVNAVHPCMIKTCGVNGNHQINYDWNATTHKLEKSSDTSGPCLICKQIQGALCDMSGAVISGTGFNEGALSPVPSRCIR